MRTIRVTGKGQIKVKPDTTRITLSLEGIYPEYSETLRRSSQDTERLKDILAGFGFNRSDLKTLNFRVDTEYENYKDKGTYKQRFAGYKFNHLMKLEFDSDNARLGKVLYALANCDVKPEFRLSYTVKDPEAAKNELLNRAVTDAKEKAFALTNAAGVTLKKVQSIDYSWGQIDFEVRPMNRMLLMEDTCAAPSPGACYDLDIEPDDIDVSRFLLQLRPIDVADVSSLLWKYLAGSHLLNWNVLREPAPGMLHRHCPLKLFIFSFQR